MLFPIPRLVEGDNELAKLSPMEIVLLKQAFLDLGDRGNDLQQYF
ncbi:MAG: hypothetical protein ACK59J_04850 [Pseudanabaena sp.]